MQPTQAAAEGVATPSKARVLSSGQEATKPLLKREQINIVVFDENRKTEKAFKCEQRLLVKYMKYF